MPLIWRWDPPRTPEVTDQLIKNFADHSANERTYLAWVRSAVALIGFGVVMERVYLLSRDSLISVDPDPKSEWSLTAEFAGLAMVLLGVLILVVATIKFYQRKMEINDESVHSIDRARSELVLTSAIVLLAITMCVYLLQAIL